MLPFFDRAAMLAAAALLGIAPASAAERTIGLTSFDRIVLNGDFAVEVVTAAPVRAIVTGPADALDRVELRSAGGVLTISDRRFASDRTRGDGAGGVVIRINAARLRSATVAGAGSLSIDRIAAAKVELGLRGPGALIVGTVTADRLTLGVIGNGRVSVGGSAKNAEMMVSGAALVDASKLLVTDLVANGEGAADQRYQARRTALVTLRGIGRIAVDGTPKCTVRNLGTGTISCGQL